MEGEEECTGAAVGAWMERVARREVVVIALKKTLIAAAIFLSRTPSVAADKVAAMKPPSSKPCL